MLVRHFKNHPPTPQKYVWVKLSTFANSGGALFHLKLLLNVRKHWQRLREWNAPGFSSRFVKMLGQSGPKFENLVHGKNSAVCHSNAATCTCMWYF